MTILTQSIVQITEMQPIPVEIPEIESTNEFCKHQHYYVAARKEIFRIHRI